METVYQRRNLNYSCGTREENILHSDKFDVYKVAIIQVFWRLIEKFFYHLCDKQFPSFQEGEIFNTFRILILYQF